MNIYRQNLVIICLTCLIILAVPLTQAQALDPGTILYRTSSKGKMYGYSTKDLIKEEYGLMTHIYPGHAAIYVGEENGEHYVVEALSTGIVKTPLKYFINESLGEEFISAKIPKAASAWQRAKAVAIAKYLASADLAYDFDFSDQKGPGSGDWTCVGLTEKLYESADAYNPERISALEYNPRYYAVDITPDGFDSKSIYNERNDVFSAELEFSKISRRKTSILPAPEIIGYNAGKEYQSNRYIFLPYTQALQTSLRSVPLDLEISSSFDDQAVRGKVNSIGLILRWSLINNPSSSVKKIARAISSIFKDDNSEALVRLSEASEIDENDDYLSKYQTDYLEVIDSVALADDFSVEEEMANSDLDDRQSIEQEKQRQQKEENLTVVGTKKNQTAEADIVKKQTTKEVAKVLPKVVKEAKASPPKTTVAKNMVNPTKNESTDLWSKIANPIIKEDEAKKKQKIAADNKKKETENLTKKGETQEKPATENNQTKNEDKKEEEKLASPLTLVISKIQAEGLDDYLEIWNYGDKDINLKEREIRVEKARTASDPGIILRFDSDSDLRILSSSVIRAGESYLIVRDDASSELLSKAQAIALRPDFTFTNSAYTLYLAKGPVSSFEDEDIIDFVGYGEAVYFEGSLAAPAMEPGYLLRRKAKANTQLNDILNGGNQVNWPPIYDSDNNGHDFLLWPLGGELVVEEEEEEEEEEEDEEEEELDNDDENEEEEADNSGSGTEGDENGEDGDTNNEGSEDGDDPGADEIIPDPEDTVFSFKPGLNSEGLHHLWSFSECQGNTSQDMVSMQAVNSLQTQSYWAVGRWGCGQRLPYGYEGTLTAHLEPMISGETFTILFNYRATDDYSNIYFSLRNMMEMKGLTVRLFPTMVEFDGFPNLAGRHAAEVGMPQNAWQQVALVWNSTESYWRLYVDGVMIFDEQFNGDAPGFDLLEMGSVCGEVAVDDIALWQRALSGTEIAFIHSSEEPFNPQAFLEFPNPLELKHEYNFDEASGSVAHDGVSGVDWNLIEGTLDYNGLTGRSYKAPATDQSSFIDIPSISTNNFSLSWWYRNENNLNDNAGRIHLAMHGSEQFLAEFTTDTARQSLNTGDWDDILYEGEVVIPHDNNWHHLALIYDNYRYVWQFYVDGRRKLENSRLPIIKSETIDRIGIRSTYYGFYLDNFKIWQGALSASDVLAEYNLEKLD